ncbi:hypothetical protein [Xanthomonas citri]|uniref:hypothetical protein n=1 Tax=Xanthomonas citri TaxID=346 RepID=UPI0018DC1D5B|nr:hypothetical protein [Xanthomonas citri]
MSQGSKPKLHIVPDTITKQEAHAQAKAGSIVRIMQGVYIDTGTRFEDVFAEFGVRLANKLFPNAALTHASAYLQRPHMDRVFVGGDYPYKKIIADGKGYEARVVQSVVRPDFNDDRLYTPYLFTDGLGKFEMYCATPELVLIQSMDATKVNPEKHLPYNTVLQIWEDAQKRAGGQEKAWALLKEIGEAVDKQAEADRFYKQFILKGT